MKRLGILIALLASTWLLATVRPQAQTTRRWRPVTDNNRWLMINTEDMMARPGGAAEAIAVCRRAKELGYNGVLVWDSNLWDRDLPEPYMANAQTLKAGLKDLDFTLFMVMCPQGAALIRWTGDDSICEPRPEHPARQEKNYRYMCLSHPGIHRVWEEQLRRAEGIYHPTGWQLQYNELMVAGTDERCRATGKTPGELLADHARKTLEICRRVSPGCVVSVWNDIFDPNHNARDHYFHAAGSFRGSWRGLDADVLVMDWNWSISSFRFWSNRGNRQIIPGFYDGQLGMSREKDLVRQARRISGVVGWMYTTWSNDFSKLKTYGDFCGFGDERASLLAPLPVCFPCEPGLA